MTDREFFEQQVGAGAIDDTGMVKADFAIAVRRIDNSGDAVRFFRGYTEWIESGQKPPEMAGYTAGEVARRNIQWALQGDGLLFLWEAALDQSDSAGDSHLPG